MFIVFGPLWFVIIVCIIHLTYKNKNKAHHLEETLTNIAGVIIMSMLFLGLGALIVHGIKTIDNNNKEIEKIKYEISQIEKNYGVIPGGWNDLSTMNK